MSLRKPNSLQHQHSPQSLCIPDQQPPPRCLPEGPTLCIPSMNLARSLRGANTPKVRHWPAHRSLQTLKSCCGATQRLSPPEELKCPRPCRSSSGLWPKSCCPSFKSWALFKAPVTSPAQHTEGSALAAEPRRAAGACRVCLLVASCNMEVV